MSRDPQRLTDYLGHVLQAIDCIERYASSKPPGRCFDVFANTALDHRTRRCKGELLAQPAKPQSQRTVAARSKPGSLICAAWPRRRSSSACRSTMPAGGAAGEPRGAAARGSDRGKDRSAASTSRVIPCDLTGAGVTEWAVACAQHSHRRIQRRGPRYSGHPQPRARPCRPSTPNRS